MRKEEEVLCLFEREHIEAQLKRAFPCSNKDKDKDVHVAPTDTEKV